MWFPVFEFFPIPRHTKTIEIVPLPDPPVLHRISSELALNPEDWASSGERDAVLAASGQGKSWLSGVLMEELLESGGQVFVIDPEGENHTLAARYPVLIMGGDHDSAQLSPDTATDAELAMAFDSMLENNVSAVFDLSSLRRQEQQETATRIMTTLFNAQERNALRHPCKLVVEEAQLFAPQKASGLPKVDGLTSLQALEDIAKRGRKRGINLLVATQRPAALSKDILSQCNRYWFGGMQASQDCAALKPYLAQAEIEEDHLRELSPGEFYYYAGGQALKIKSRSRRCPHGGNTPTETQGRKLPTHHQLALVTENLTEARKE